MKIAVGVEQLNDDAIELFSYIQLRRGKFSLVCWCLDLI